MGLDGALLTGREPECGPVEGLGTGLTATFLTPQDWEQPAHTGRIRHRLLLSEVCVLCPARSPMIAWLGSREGAAHAPCPQYA